MTLGVVTIQPAIADHEDAILEMISLRAGTFALGPSRSSESTTNITEYVVSALEQGAEQGQCCGVCFSASCQPSV